MFHEQTFIKTNKSLEQSVCRTNIKKKMDFVYEHVHNKITETIFNNYVNNNERTDNDERDEDILGSKELLF